MLRSKFHKKPESKRPLDNDFTQQKFTRFPGHTHKMFLYLSMIILGIVSLVIGIHLFNDAEDIYEKKIRYDGGSGDYECNILNPNEGKICYVNFTITEDISPGKTLFLYYQLDHYFQNHRRYYLSRSRRQLNGENLSESEVSLDCTPLIKNGSDLLNPCGLIANSFFTDKFSISTDNTSGPNIKLDETGIVLETDEDFYKQVEGFKYVEIDSDSPDGINCLDYNLPENCKFYHDVKLNKNYLFYYPDDDKIVYLYETYPNHISPIEGVTNEHFMIWMRVSSLPTFRKLYGRIEEISLPGQEKRGWKKGDVLSIQVEANYEVNSIDSKKELLISTLGTYGGKNVFLGQAYITVGVFILVTGMFLTVKYYLKKNTSYFDD